MFDRIIRWSAVGALSGCLSLVGCSGSSNRTDVGPAAAGKVANEGGQKSLTIAVIPKSTGGEFWQTVEVGAKSAAKDLGVNIKWEGALVETEIADENKIIENMVNLGVDGIAMAPINPKAMRKPVENAVAAGIPVVVFDSALDGDAQTSFVATDNTAGGALGAKYLVEKLPANSKRVIILRYIQGTSSTENRAQGFLDTAKAGGVQMLADAYTEDGQVSGAKKTSANVLEGFVKDGKLELDGIFCCNLNATQGMLAALDDLHKSGVTTHLVFVGFDSSPKMIEQLQHGDIDALVVQNPKKMGYLAVETLVKHLRGEKVEPRIDTGVELVTAERVEKEPEIRKLVGLE
jgi:ribose transport system substrate-binding protein